MAVLAADQLPRLLAARRRERHEREHAREAQVARRLGAHVGHRARCYRGNAASGVARRTPVRIVILALVLASCSAPPLDVSLAHGSEAEARTRAQLLRLAADHDLTPFTFTRTIAIDADAIPHSHPVLTLHTRHLDDDDLLLSTFVHEQAHWWLDAHPEARDAAVVELRATFGSLPIGFPDGARDARSNDEHLIVDHLEHTAMRCLVGEERAARALAFWETDHYRMLYALEQQRGADIDAIVAAHALGYSCRGPQM
jgi:hypothetical protein